MEKNIFILLICVLLAISNSQIPKQNSNLKSLRRLEESEETILLGFSDYQYGVNPDNKINSIFKTHFLLKNWNDSIYNNNDPFENIYINSTVTNQTKFMQNVTYNCSFYPAESRKYNKLYCLITFICQTNLSSFPKKINIYTDFEKEIKLNKEKEVTYESTSAKAIKKDITSLKEFRLNPYDIYIMQNASFVTKNENSFIIKGKQLNDIAQSKNVELITLVNGYPKKIPCIVYKNDDSEEEEDEGMYFIKTDGETNLANAELKYALINNTKRDILGILDFKEGENSTFIENTYVPKKKKGLSTGAIVAIIIPSCIVLLGVSALVFLLSRKPLPAQPIKNIGNNTIGVASSEAVVHQ
jgi:hypothetical protein